MANKLLNLNPNSVVAEPSDIVNADWNASEGAAQILNKPNLATVATTGSYNDLINKPNNLQTTDNLVTTISASSTDTQYPSAKCVYDAIQEGGSSGDARYALVTPTVTTSTTTATDDTISVTLSDLSVNSVTVPSSVAYVNIKFPEKTTGMARDFFLRLTITGSVPEITFKEYDNTTPSFDVTDIEWANIGQGVNIIAFMETSQP